MHPNTTLIETFYRAFQERDGEAMAACYHKDARFSDPAFPGLRGKEPGYMWKMLTSRAKDLEILFSDVSADADQGSAHWEARYTFSATGRKVHNVIDASFTFRDGLIYAHNDNFDFWRWSRQALGPLGLLLGWSPLLRSRLQGTAKNQLRTYIAEQDGLSASTDGLGLGE